MQEAAVSPLARTRSASKGGSGGVAVSPHSPDRPRLVSPVSAVGGTSVDRPWELASSCGAAPVVPAEVTAVGGRAAVFNA